MANVNQSPAGQTTLTLSIPRPNLIDVGESVWSMYLETIAASSIDFVYQINSSGSQAPALPTTGQIWPSGVYY